LRVAVEAVAAACVRDQAEELLRAQVVDPGVGSVRRLDDVLAGFIVEVTELHGETFQKVMGPSGEGGAGAKPNPMIALSRAPKAPPGRKFSLKPVRLWSV